MVKLTLGGFRVLSPRGHFYPANRCITLFCLRNFKSGFGFGPVGVDPDVMSSDQTRRNLTCCCGGCRQVTDPGRWDRSTCRPAGRLASSDLSCCQAMAHRCARHPGSTGC